MKSDNIGLPYIADFLKINTFSLMKRHTNHITSDNSGSNIDHLTLHEWPRLEISVKQSNGQDLFLQ